MLWKHGSLGNWGEDEDMGACAEGKGRGHANDRTFFSNVSEQTL